ncbi:carbohydrate-binding module family 50 protein [Backusella circina FSU 941]|nr:carbohydrate-binding module family 50 protein [Backusella circina FSU 941]
MANGRFGALADPASQGSAIAFDGQELSSDYLSAFSLDNLEDNDVDFELSDEIADTHVNLFKRADCSKLYTVSGSDTCSTISKKYGISLDNFYSWNPQVKKGCPNLHNGKKYCVGKSTHVKKLASKKTKGAKKAAKKGTKKVSSSKETRKKLQTKSAFTYYWIAQEEDYKKGHTTAVKTCSGQTIEKVSSDYADALVMEGTGVIGSKIVNLGGCSCSGYKCFEIIDKKSDPYGLTSYGTPLRPYATIASNDLKKNTKIFVPDLVGWKIPGSGKTHNGCLLVDDESWSFKGHHIDFYVYAMKNYKVLDKQHHINSVDIYEGGSCKLLNYM